MFEKKFRKIDKIEYKGYEIPIYSNGRDKFAGHPTKDGNDENVDKIYSVNDIDKIKNSIYMSTKFNMDMDDFLPDSIGNVKIRKPFKIFNESKIKEIVKKHLNPLI